MSTTVSPSARPESGESLGPPSLQQEPLWFLHRLSPTDSAYHIAFALELDGDLDLPALRAALEAVVEVQDCLRMSLPTELGRARLHRHPPEPVEVEHWDAEEHPAGVSAVLQEAVDRPFDLGTFPLFRFVLVRLDASAHVLGCVFHHVIFDGVSVELFIRDLSSAYTAYVGRTGAALPPLPVPFSSFVDGQLAALCQPGAAAARDYWREALAGVPALQLPTDHLCRPSSEVGAKGRVHRRILPLSLVQAVHDRAQASSATTFMVLLAALKAFLARHAEASDLAIGTPISLRMAPPFRERIGLFVNTAVIRSRFDGRGSFGSYLETVKRACVAAYRHHRLPFAQVVEAVAPERALGQNPLFSVMFILHAPPRVPPFPGLQVRHRELSTSSAKFDLTVSLAEGERGYELSLEYREARFSAQTIARMAERFEIFLSGVLASPEVAMASLSLCTAEEAATLRRWGDGGPLIAEKNLVGLAEAFEARAEHAPDRVVLREGEREVTVRGLWTRVRAIAGALQARGIGPQDRLGLALHPGEELLAAALAALRLGVAYIPLNPELPVARLRTMIDEVRPTLVLVGPGEEGIVASSSSAQEVPAVQLVGPLAERLPSVPLDQRAYIIFTSGSTGRPKGVQISQGSLARSVYAFAERAALPPGARWAALATFAFDISVLELFLPAVVDGVAEVVPRAVAADGQALARWLDRVRPTVLQTTPTRYRLLIAAGWKGHADLVVLTGGERLSVELAAALHARAARVLNVYGPTEGTVWSTLYEVQPEDLEGRTAQEGLSLGGPLPGLRLYVLDETKGSVPLGVAGEIHIAGAQVGSGYFAGLAGPDNRGGTQAFGALPTLEEPRAYATGDRARFRSDGALEFLGRVDRQVKIRGHRIELGEVEAYLRSLPDVEEAAAVLHAEGHASAVAVGSAASGPALALTREQLVAYVVPRPGRALAGGSVREALSPLLPEVMVPSIVTVLSELPRTPSGKLDRNALPAPAALAPTHPVRATDLLEIQIAQVWRDVLRRPVDRDADFFALGGQSVAAVELAARLEVRLGCPVSVMDVFRTRTVARLAEHFRSGGFKVAGATIVAHRGLGARPPLFFIGGSNLALGLDRALDPSIPLFSLNLFGLVPEEGEVPTPEISDIARAYAEDLQRVQPTGPYQLLAYCADTKVALAVARRLEDLGETVGFFGIVDVISREGTRTGTLSQVLALFRDFGVDYPRALLTRRGREMWLRWHRQTARLASLTRGSKTRELTKQQRHHLFYQRYLEALRHGKERAFSGEVTFFLSTEFYRRTTTERIEALAGRPARVFEVPGFHGHLFDPPWVETLAAQLDRVLLAAPDAELSGRSR